MSTPPKITVPFINRVLLVAAGSLGICLLSSIPPKMTAASDFTDQSDGTINLAPPKILVTSMVATPFISLRERSSSEPPKIFTRSPPLKFLEIIFFFTPPKTEVACTKSSLEKLVSSTIFASNYDETYLL